MIPRQDVGGMVTCHLAVKGASILSCQNGRQAALAGSWGPIWGMLSMPKGPFLMAEWWRDGGGMAPSVPFFPKSDIAFSAVAKGMMR